MQFLLTPLMMLMATAPVTPVQAKIDPPRIFFTTQQAFTETKVLEYPMTARREEMEQGFNRLYEDNWVFVQDLGQGYTSTGKVATRRFLFLRTRHPA